LETLVSKHITIEQVVHALQSQDDGSRVLVTYNADDQNRIDVRSMDLLYVIIGELAEAIQAPVGP
jgi:hypothetical protein